MTSTGGKLTQDPNSTFVLTLEYGKNYEHNLYQFENGWCIRFVLGTTLWGKKVKLFTTYPLADVSTAQTVGDAAWYEVNLLEGSSNGNDAFDLYADVVCQKPGPHRFVYLCDDCTIAKPNGCGYFQVLPVVKWINENCRLQTFYCQTMLAKLLGPFPEWEGRLVVATHSGFNMIHLTPIQKLGISNSSYSIADQLELNPAFVPQGMSFNFDHVAELSDKMLKEHRTFLISDVVWNHTAKNSHWLQEHPECSYNLYNSPHLRPAFVLDRLLAHFGQQVAEGKWEHKGLPKERWEGYHLETLKNVLLHDIYPAANLPELLQVDLDQAMADFSKQLDACSGPSQPGKDLPPLRIIQDVGHRRLRSTVDVKLALSLFNKSTATSEEARKEECKRHFRDALVDLNNNAARQCWDELRSGVNALLGHVSYERVEERGPKYKDYNEHHPLFPTYFYYNKKTTDWQSDEAAMHGDYAKFIMAHNGWVMNDDPLGNFAEPPSRVFFKRELIAWGDSVKLRYGDKPSDCPYLWERMKSYSQISAKIFNGFRLDNCHSTPIHVAEYLLKEARLVRPQLFVVAELFTQSEGVDNYFVNRLGINALIREAMAAPDPHEQGRLAYRYGGIPVGSFYPAPYQPLVPGIALAMMFDQTHDNPSLMSARTPYDLLPTAAMVGTADCAIGSNRGYDELVPYHVHVVSESRLYTTWTKEEKATRDTVNMDSGIIGGRKAIATLHHYMSIANFNEIFVDQKTEDVTVIRRYCPTLMESIVWIIRNCFDNNSLHRVVHLEPINLAGTLRKILFQVKLTARNEAARDSSSQEVGQKYIVGLSDYGLSLKEDVVPVESDLIVAKTDEKSQVTTLEIVDLPPSSVIAMNVSITDSVKVSMKVLHFELSRVNAHISKMLRFCSMENYTFQTQHPSNLIKNLSLLDINYVLFRGESEEQCCRAGWGAYDVPNYGRFVYCGLQAVHYHMSKIRINNDLGHPLCDNIRQGDWLADYITNRLLAQSGTKELGEWFSGIFNIYKRIPHFIKPCYFEIIISSVYKLLLDEIWNKMSSFVQKGSLFLRSLAVSSVIFCGSVPSAPLPMLSRNLKFSNRDTFTKIVQDRQATTIAAGLPHFGAGLFRNWGRDTFISLPGLLLVTGRYDEARAIILGYAGCLRHGLIPNLLGEGTHARYNCRDAVWWWLLSIKAYVDIVPNGIEILKDPVNRVYANDLAEPYSTVWEQPLHDTVQEALDIHFQGRKFRERNSGADIDQHMRDEGFNLEIGVDLDTGFVFGGNQWNCGTWMDKMGSSEKAGNRGVPATPRDGSAVELVGISYAIVSWLDTLHSQGQYPYAKVKRINGCSEISWTWNTWKSAILNKFETCFWIPADQSETLPAVTDANLINVRGIYKDTFKSSQPWADYQFRPNFTVALAIAPDLFDPKHAEIALQQARDDLLGPLGMKTLTQKDCNYNGYYDNSNDSMLSNVAKGFNYHQGPEWLWPFGFFLRAKLAVAKVLAKTDPSAGQRSVSEVQRLMGTSWIYLKNDQWFSLPELTNKDGAHCRDSCGAQAWSVGSLLEVFYDLDKFSK